MTNFPKGNLDSWNFAITSYFPTMFEKINIVDTTCKAALTALVGTEKFEGKAGHLDFKYSKDGTPEYVKVILVYESPPLQLSYASEEAVEHDTLVIQSYLNQIEFLPDDEEDAVKIDIKKGSVTVTFGLEISGV
jgi:hypothetical protein